MTDEQRIARAALERIHDQLASTVGNDVDAIVTAAVFALEEAKSALSHLDAAGVPRAERGMDIQMMSGVNPRGVPFVQITWGAERGQFTPAETRQHALSLVEVAEAAEHDSLLFAFLTDGKGLDQSAEAAASILGSLRRYRRHEPDASGRA